MRRAHEIATDSRPATPDQMKSLFLSLLAFLAITSQAAGAEPKIGLAAPLSGDAAILGTQMLDGATLAAAGDARDLEIVNDACTAEGGAAAARSLAERGVSIVIGFLCTEAIEAALPILTQARIPVITTGVRADALTDRRERTGWLVFRLAPRADFERSAVAAILTRRWSDVLFAIVDDGTIYGRELAESLRFSAEERGHAPVFVDTFRPQLDNQIALAGRLRQAGATHVFAGGDRDDIALIARDAHALDFPLVVAGGESLRSAPGEVDIAEGTLMVGLPEWSRMAPEDVLARFRREGIEPEGYALPTYAAFQIADMVLDEARDGDADLSGVIDGREFTTVIGPVAFDENGDISVNPYALFRYDGSSFRPVEAP